MTPLFLLILVIIVLLVVYIYRNSNSTEAFEDYFKSENEYKNQVKLLTDKYESMSDRRRPVADILNTNVMPVEEQCFVNFYALGCRYTGYIGPMNEGYFDPDTAIQLAVKAGCRTFVLEIDYLDECTGETVRYFPRIVVRDAQGKLRINYNSSKPRCNSSDNSTIRDVCEKINYYAFASSCQNKDDPVVIVLYFLRQPPGSYKSKTVLDYYSHVAKALAPFKNRLLGIELEGGTYYRQSQEGRLLINNITTYNGKVLIFSNANTSGFRETKIYSSNEDLDFLTGVGATCDAVGVDVERNRIGLVPGVADDVGDCCFLKDLALCGTPQIARSFLMTARLHPHVHRRMMDEEHRISRSVQHQCA
jgi:hypothetical protein